MHHRVVVERNVEALHQAFFFFLKIRQVITDDVLLHNGDMSLSTWSLVLMPQTKGMTYLMNGGSKLAKTVSGEVDRLALRRDMNVSDVGCTAGIADEGTCEYQFHNTSFM